jgi:hypothetical protein
MYRVPTIVRGPRMVRLAGLPALRLAPCAPALATVGPESHLDLSTPHTFLRHDSPLVIPVLFGDNLIARIFDIRQSCSWLLAEWAAW